MRIQISTSQIEVERTLDGRSLEVIDSIGQKIKKFNLSESKCRHGVQSIIRREINKIFANAKKKNKVQH